MLTLTLPLPLAPAGTVLCPECHGTPHFRSLTPNMAKMFRAEPPFWMRTLNRMGELGTLDVSAAAHRRQRLLAGAAATSAHELTVLQGRGGGGGAAAAALGSSGRQLGEVPNQPFKDIEIQAALDSSGSLWNYQPRAAMGGAEQDYGPRDPLGYAPNSSGREADIGNQVGVGGGGGG